MAATLKTGLNSWVSWMKSSVAAFTPPRRELSEEEVALRQVRVHILCVCWVSGVG
jgi:hypothetical protein